MFWNQTLNVGVLSWDRLSWRKNVLLSSRSRSQWGLIIKIWLFNNIFCTYYLFATKLGLMVHHHKLECLLKHLYAVYKVKVTAKVWNISECLSWQYLLNHLTFCNQTWYGGVLSWAGLSCKNIVLLSLRWKSQRRLSFSKCDCFYYIF